MEQNSEVVLWDVALQESFRPPVIMMEKPFLCFSVLHRAYIMAVLSLQVQMGNLNFLLGRVQYDTESQLTFPLEAQIGLGVGASFVALIVLVIVFIYR